MLREDRKFVKTFNIFFSNILERVDIKKNESICEIIFRPEEILHCMQKNKVHEAHKYFKNTKLAPKPKVKCQHSRKFQILIPKNWLRKTILY